MIKILKTISLLAIVLLIIFLVPYFNGKISLVLLSFLLFVDYKKDQLTISWKRFLHVGIGIYIILFIVNSIHYELWTMLEKWEVKTNPHPFALDEWMSSIPFNDASFTRIYQAEWLTKLLQWCYGYGFTVSVTLCITRSFFTKNAKKMVQYMLATFFLQFPLIVPFYALFDVNEVWYVFGHPDGLERGLSYPDVLYIVHNCFPSMHTSIAFSVLLLSLREKDRLFKWTKIIYSVLIIFSTMYLEIHWVVDVLAGLLFAYLVVKLSDFILKKLPKRIKEKIEVKPT